MFIYPRSGRNPATLERFRPWSRHYRRARVMHTTMTCTLSTPPAHLARQPSLIDKRIPAAESRRSASREILERQCCAPQSTAVDARRHAQTWPTRGPRQTARTGRARRRSRMRATGTQRLLRTRHLASFRSRRRDPTMYGCLLPCCFNCLAKSPSGP